MTDRSDTSLGGPRNSFPNTTMGLVGRLRQPGSDLSEFCRRYWRPFFAYVRVVCAKSNEDAKDLTQGFFTWLLESDVLRKYAPEQGSFRAYLKVVLARFVKDQDKAGHRLKRGGGQRIVELDEAVMNDAPGGDPGEAFDREWAMALARVAIDRVREKWSLAGQASRFRAYEEYDLADHDKRPTYDELAARLGLKPADVRHALAAARDEIRAEIRMELATGAAGEQELKDEWNVLFGS